jgi:hypothetical protein
MQGQPRRDVGSNHFEPRKPEQHAGAARHTAHIRRVSAFHAVARREVVADYSLLYTWEAPPQE